jgi:hypothetical protein
MLGSFFIFMLTPVPSEAGNENKEVAAKDKPLFGFLEAAARVAPELVATSQHLGRAKLAQTGADGRVWFNVD